MRGKGGRRHQNDAWTKLNRFKIGRDKISNSEEILSEISRLDMRKLFDKNNFIGMP